MERFPIRRPSAALPAAAVGALLLGAGVTLAAPVPDPDMMALADASGCASCHALDAPRAVGEAVPAVAPSWRDIARSHRGRAGAADALARTIVRGSGANGEAAHWKDRASGMEMPPSRVEVTERDARRLAEWILSLAREAPGK